MLDVRCSTPGVVMLDRATRKGQDHIVDEFNMQFDRDLEPLAPMTGREPAGYGDDYYLQFAANVRRYKGLVAPPPASPPRSIPVTADGAAWAGVTPVFHDTVHDVGNRDWPGCPPGVHYADTSARNDLATAQVARDDRSVTFRVTTAEPLTPPTTDGTWMTLLVDADANATTGWHGYDLLVNRTRAGDTASIERYAGDGTAWAWTRVADAPVHVAADAVTVAVPRPLFGRGQLRFDFKWTDNLPAAPTLADFYTGGDVAPDGRFTFHYAGQ